MKLKIKYHEFFMYLFWRRSISTVVGSKLPYCPTFHGTLEKNTKNMIMGIGHCVWKEPYFFLCLETAWNTMREM